jgi:hypothetical protein
MLVLCDRLSDASLTDVLLNARRIVVDRVLEEQRSNVRVL